MLVDQVVITVEGGKGGNGRVSFYPGMKSGPNGGNGGNGGSVIIRATDTYHALTHLSRNKKITAEHGSDGEPFTRDGSFGNDTIIEVPPGTDIIDVTSDTLLTTLEKPGDGITVCRGGVGGYGNNHYKSSTNRTPRKADQGTKGQKRTIKISMKLIADVGLIGLPNAGKSSLLNVLTKANPKIAPYPFTTLEPNLGVMEKIVIADIPGLIEGASVGKGLGLSFLKHIEKVSILVHCISMEVDDYFSAYNTVRNELVIYSETLLQKEELILLTKSDLISEVRHREKLVSLKAKLPGVSIFTISIFDEDSIASFKNSLSRKLGN